MPAHPPRYPRVAAAKTADDFAAQLAAAGVALPFATALTPPSRSPFAWSLAVPGGQLANRFAILPMEGWDGTVDGRPSPLTERRWRHFGASGASLIWGGEAVAVRHDGRANPRQLMLTDRTAAEIGGLAASLRQAHAERYGQSSADALYIGLQLTHSGRFSRPDAHDAPAPLVAYEHPWLDARTGPVTVLTDDDLDRLCDEVIDRARLARELGFQFVDIKHCHGYLAHELLSARSRPGRYGGSLDHRVRFLRTIVDGIRTVAPGLAVGVRVSAFDAPPYRPGADGVGRCEVASDAPYPFAFGRLDDENLDRMMADARAWVTAIRALDVRLLCVTGGSPYYCPHVLRPALFPPSDGYQPPEDPLKGVARHLTATAYLKAAFPDLIIVGSGYSYLQEWLPHVAEPVLREGGADLIGLGRMVLSYPEFAADVLAGRPLRRQALCRTFSDCTTGPRNGLVSGCYPLDAFYRTIDDYAALSQVKSR